MSPRELRRPRPRSDRITALIVSTTVVCVAALGGIGWLPSSSAQAKASAAIKPTASVPVAKPTLTPEVSTVNSKLPNLATPTTATAEIALPTDSGTGRRVVFSISEQRVWLVDSSETVARSYLVSGSVTDNLQPGSYSVYSRSRNAVGIDDSGTMEYFVRFTRGENAAIGFHSIPVLDGSPVQTVAQLGTPLSHGCIRQKLDDAIQLWDFAPIGTRVVVTA